MHKPLIAALLVALMAGLVLWGGCAPPPEPEKPVQKPIDPGWPNITLAQAEARYCLDEAHYHIWRGHYLAPASFGQTLEMRLAWNYTRSAINLLPVPSPAAEAAVAVAPPAPSPAPTRGPMGGAPAAPSGE